MRIFHKIVDFYYDGFCQMTVGKKLWMIIFIKLFVMFVIFKLIFFHDFLGSKFNTDKEKSDYVVKELTH